MNIIPFASPNELASQLQNFTGYTIASIYATTIPKVLDKDRTVEKWVTSVKSVMSASRVKPGTFIEDLEDDILRELLSVGAISNGRVEVPASVTFGSLFRGRIMKSCRYSSVGFGSYSYQGMVNKRRREEGHPDQFVANKPNGMVFLDGSTTILKNDSDDILYLRAFKFNNTTTDEIYHYEDGTQLSDHGVARLRSGFLQIETDSIRQEVENVVRPISFKLDGIVYIKLGNTIHCNHRFVADVQRKLESKSTRYPILV